MKPILTLLCFAFVLSSKAASVGIAWDFNTDTITRGYFVYVIQAGNTIAKVDAGNNSSLTVAGLNPATEYSFFVTAYDASKKESGRSASVTTTTAAAQVPAPGVPVISGFNWSKNADGTYNITINWQIVTGATGYTAQLSNAAGSVLATIGSTTGQATFSNIPQGAYSVSARSLNASGSSSFSSPFTISLITTASGVRVVSASE